MCNFILTIIISTVTGILASFTLWYFVTKYLVPKITFSDYISKIHTSENESGFKYRFKFENSGKRNIIDLEIIVRLRIKGLHKDLPNNWEVIYLPTSTLQYNKVAIVRPLRSNKIRPVLEIKTYDCPFFKSEFFNSDIRKKAESRTLTLDDLFDLGLQTDLQILILGFDQFSGARKFFESKNYTINDIKTQYFNRNSI